MSIYKKSGVDIDKGNTFVNNIKSKLNKTHNKNVLNQAGGFASIFNLDTSKYKNPLLLSSTDGVGTKLKLAFMSSKHKTIGIDLVAMCVNDILVYGAKPLFFLDYLASGKLSLDVSNEIIDGIVEGCLDADCALVGGETAEMPSFYSSGEYDLAGFSVGVVEKEKLIDGTCVKEGDTIVALSSSGVHSNGFSLLRHVFFTEHSYDVYHKFEELNLALIDELLKPTHVYVKPVLNIVSKYKISAMSHITGGGLIENVPRVLPDGFCANIDSKLINVPSIFNIIKNVGNVPLNEMFRVFNMGVGFVLICDKNDSDRICEGFKKYQIDAYPIGNISKSNDFKINISGLGKF